MTNPVVSVIQGALRGKTKINYVGDKFYSFCGIPYAKAPVGNLRFRAPEPAEKWEGIYDATKEGPECPSKHMILSYFVGKEDNCLNLNVFTKKLPSEDAILKPVMVWIHGGGFISGSNKTDLYGPHYLMMEDIVLVSINYRLGVLGFLSVEDESLNIPGNAGLKDQVMALKWIRDNISQFGGDPSNVTLFGESAGSASVNYLILSPLAKGLFHKAIMQSGCAINYWAQGTKGTKEICRALGYMDTDQIQIIDYLRKLSAKSLVAASSRARDGLIPGIRRFYGPVVEKPSETAFLTDKPESIINSGNYNKVPMIIGYTSREGFLFEIIRKNHPGITLPKDLSLELDFNYKIADDTKREEVAGKIKDYYYGEEDISDKNISKTVLMKTDSIFLHKIHQTIGMFRQTNTEPVYVYRLDLDTSLNVFKKIAIANWMKCFFVTNHVKNRLQQGFIKSQLEKLCSILIGNQLEGTSHADDICYLFRTTIGPTIEAGSAEDVAVRRFVKMWTNFAKFGNPTPETCADFHIDVTWPPVEGEKNYLNIDRTLTVMENPESDRIRFWDGLYEQYTTAKASV